MGKRMFKMSYRDRREAFVQDRFCELQNFGCSNVEELLREARGEDRPSPRTCGLLYHANELRFERTNPEFPTLVAPLRYSTSFLGTDLSRYAETLGAFSSLLDALGDHRSRNLGVYLGGEYAIVVSWGETADVPPLAVHIIEQETFAGEPVMRQCTAESNVEILARAVIDVRIDEWADQRTHAGTARAALCNDLADEIAAVRAEAIIDFGLATAMSQDGTKICTANVVVVVEMVDTGAGDDPRCTRFPVGAFSYERLVLPKRYSSVRYNATIEAYLRGPECPASAPPPRCEFDIPMIGFAPGEQWQKLVRCNDGNVLLTTPACCPDPLPEGGVVIPTPVRLA